MKIIPLCGVALLSSTLSYSQETDTIQTKRSIEEIIVNTYIKKDTEYTNKMPLRAIENSQVYSSVDRVAIENQLIFSVDDAYRNVTGLQKMWNATNRSGDGGAYVNLRGFISNNSLRDGLVAPVSGTMDAINIEKVEVLKGPSAALYGSNMTSYGGVINRVTKKPFEEFGGSVSIAGGSYNFYRAQADINSPLTKKKDVLFRLNTAYTNEGNFQNTDAKSKYFALAPSLSWKVNDRVQVHAEYEMFENKTSAEQNIFFIFSPSNLGYNSMKDLEDIGLQYKNYYTGTDLINTGKVRNLFGQVTYQISKGIKSTTAINNAYSYSNGFNPYFYLTTASYGADPTDETLGLYRGDQSTGNSTQRIFQVQQNFNFDFKLGSLRNRLIVGGDYMRTKNDQLFYYGVIDFVPFTGDMDYTNFNAAYVTAYYDNLRENGTFDASTWPLKNKLNTYSFYASDVLNLTEELNVMASIRYEKNDFLGGIQGSSETPKYSQSAWSPKFGVVYEFVKDKISVFGNYQNSFTSNGYYVVDSDGNTALSDPERANQWEGGLKTSLLDGRINATINYYNIAVKNTLQTTGYTTGGIAIQDQAGKLKSEGFELEMNAYLVKGFSVIAGLSYNNSKYTETTDNTVLDRRPNTASSPWLANFYANYQFVDGPIKGLGFGVGGNYANANRIFNTTSAVFELPSYFVMNANAFYDFNKFRIALKGDNLTNKHYWIGYTTANPQKLRNIVASFSYKF
ncbi:TonB-dependent siderophore receptor [Sphingobacterium sp. LRF_L2]|uniref:TonB-dependent siderophore receptor n=1 Tax=Sphingobacterium sp. LRF_L2 TaxID=3369421 RepID=UPI003F626606